MLYILVCLEAGLKLILRDQLMFNHPRRELRMLGRPGEGPGRPQSTIHDLC